MTKERKMELFDEALAWIYDRVKIRDYVLAMKHIGFTKGEVYYELEVNCYYDMTNSTITEFVEEIYKD